MKKTENGITSIVNAGNWFATYLDSSKRNEKIEVPFDVAVEALCALRRESRTLKRN